MGFGHRVYKSYDPRARDHQADRRRRSSRSPGRNPLLDIALELERIALEDDYFVTRKLYPNVDFYSGLIYQAMGFPVDMFPVLFAIPRTAGWLAQWEEMLLDPDQKIARPRQIYIGAARRDYVAAGSAQVTASAGPVAAMGRILASSRSGHGAARGRRLPTPSDGSQRPTGARRACRRRSTAAGRASTCGSWSRSARARPARRRFDKTRAYITRQLTALGLTVEEQPFTAQTPLGAVEMVNLIVDAAGPRGPTASSHRPLRHEAVSRLASSSARATARRARRC